MNERESNNDYYITLAFPRLPRGGDDGGKSSGWVQDGAPRVGVLHHHQCDVNDARGEVWFFLYGSPIIIIIGERKVRSVAIQKIK